MVIELKDGEGENDGKAEEEEARIKKMGITLVSFFTMQYLQQRYIYN